MESPSVRPKILACQPRVLVVDNDPAMRDDHVRNLTRWRYQPVVAQGQGPALQADAIQKARHYRCHVALVDMRLEDDYNRHDTSGLKLVPKLRPAVSIVVSGYGDRATVVEALTQMEASNFVGKEEGPQRLKEAIDSAIRGTCGCRHDFEIEWAAELSSASILKALFPDDPLAALDEADDILGRLFPDAHHLRLETLSGAARTPSITLHPRSMVFKVWPDQLQPMVVKFARASRIQEEFERYHKYVRGQLVGNRYAQIEKHVALWDLGGVIYNFLGGAVEEMTPFTQFYSASRSVREVISPLRRLFGEVWHELYHNRQASEAEPESLFTAYTAVWGSSWLDRLRQFSALFPTLEVELPGSSPPLRLPNPIRWVLNQVGLEGLHSQEASHIPDTVQAVTHGDLLGDNFFVDRHKEPWTIDYERTGPGPILQDFVELESDIVTRLAAFQADELSLYYQLVVAVCAEKAIDLLPTPKGVVEHAAASRALEVIRELRTLAKKQTGSRDARPYLWSLLFNAVFRATLIEDGLTRTRALVLGSIVGQRLERWDEPTWPPEGWPAVEWAAPRRRTGGQGDTPLSPFGDPAAGRARAARETRGPGDQEAEGGLGVLEMERGDDDHA